MSLINVDTIQSRTGGPPTLSQGVVVSAAATFSGDVSIGGTLTYEDVTNVDVIGIVTARNGIKIGAAGIGGTIAANGNTTLAGVVTATSFSGAATGLTGVPGGQITGALAAVDGSALTGMANTANVNTAGLNVVGVATVGVGLTLADNVHAKFGNAGDLQIYHNGSNSFVKGSGTGNLALQSNGTSSVILQPVAGENSVVANSNGSVDLYFDNSKKFETLSTGVKVTGVTSTTSLSVGPGVLQEKLYNVASALTGTVNFDVVDNGLVQYYTTNSSGTFVVNLRGDGSTTFNSLMDIGKTTVFTLYSAQNNASYYMTDFQIDGSSITEKWNGGSAPSAGTASGTDVYTFNIMKTADATFTVFATFSYFA